MSKQWLRTPSSQDLCIFCASRLYFTPPPSVVPLARPLYTQRRALQSSARVRKPAAAAAALQDEGEQDGVSSRPSHTPINPPWAGLTKPHASPAVAPVRLTWDGWSATLEEGSKAQVRSGVPPGQKQSTERVNIEGGDSDAVVQTLKGGTTTKGKVGSEQGSGGWARYAAPKKPIQEEEQFGEKSMTLSQDLFHGLGSKRKKSTRRGAERWNCSTCGASVNSRATNCHYCREPRQNSEVTTSYNHQQKNRQPAETSAKVEETDITAANHWKHVRRRAGSAGVGEIGDGTGGGTDDQKNGGKDITADRLAQEREERLRVSANGGYVGFKGAQSVNGNIETRGSAIPDEPGSNIYSLRKVHVSFTDFTPGPAQEVSPAARRIMNDRPAYSEDFVKELPSQSNELATQKIHASTPTSDGWKAWEPPVQQSEDSGTQPPEIKDGPTITYHKIGPPPKIVPKIEDGPTVRYREALPSPKLHRGPRTRRVVFDDSIRSTIWKSANPNSSEQGTAVSQASGNEKRRDEYTERRSANGVPSRAIARDMVMLDTSADRSRVAERNSSRMRQQRAADFDDEDESVLARIERRRQRKKEKAFQSSNGPPTPIILPEYISVGNLATVLRVRIEDFVRRMKSLGFEETNNDHVLDAETAGLIAADFNFEPVTDQGSEVDDLVAFPLPEDKSYLLQRPPVITIMGHVDHGKTTLLDYLRKSSVAASEHGGITQHIGAFTVPMPSGQIVTFLDTPGHAAFLSMRQRGANVTDIVILVVAADDSVKPQTIEAINHAKTANVPMIVAINKIDKPDADVTRVKQDLARHGVEVEDFGGDTQVVCVSGKTGQGMEELEDAAVALADVLDLRAEADGQAEGWILEATTKKGGRVATVLVRRGTVIPGSVIVAGTTWARVRSLRNEAGQTIPSAGPGTPAEVDGWREQPEAGDEVLQAPNEQRAKDVVQLRLSRKEKEKLAADVVAVNEARRLEQEKREREEAAAKATASGEAEPVAPADEVTRITEIPFIVRGDVSGSVEAVVDSISSLGNSEVRPTILRSAVGPIAPTDVEHAAAAKGHIISFNTVVEGSIRRMAEAARVSILDQSIIYRLVDDVKAKLESVLPELVTTRVTGEAEVAQVFEINSKGRVTVPVAGCRVRNGVIGRTSNIRVVRGGEVVYTGTLSSLKNQKKNVTEMRKGAECGMGFEGFTDFKVGDQVQCYEEKSEKRKL